LPTNSGGGIIGTNACASRATRAATRSPILLTGVERISIDGPPPDGNPNLARYCTGRTAHIGVWARLVCSLAGEAADEVFFTRPHGEWTDDRIDAWLIARDIDRDHVTETTAKAWSAAGELVVQHRQALERLALHLVDAGEMSGAQVDALLGSRVISLRMLQFSECLSPLPCAPS
jgi:hypothetical protein